MLNNLEFSVFGIANLAVYSFLGFLSVLALSVSIFKALQFMRMGVGKAKESAEIIRKLHGDSRDEAYRYAERRRTVRGRVLFSMIPALAAETPDLKLAEDLAKQTALEELAIMNRRMKVLEMVVQAAPMLGLLGTVVGMINAFSAIAGASSAVDPSDLADGIWTALISTAIGLGIALVSYMLAMWLEGRIDSERRSLELLIGSMTRRPLPNTPA